MQPNTGNQTPETPRARRKAFYLLPNLFTTAALFLGFYAVVSGIAGRFAAASMAIFIAMIMDGLDGRVARLTNTTSDFGKEYDSLSDMVSFGVAPALVMYQWAFKGMADLGPAWAKIGWLGAFFYAVTAAIRLARFNARASIVGKRFFQGLPSPAAAGIVAGFVWLGTDLQMSGQTLLIPAYVLTVGAGALMVSNIRYYSFKDINLSGRVPFAYIMVVPLVFMLIALSPPKVLFLSFFAYALSGIVLVSWRLLRRRRRRSERSGHE